MWEVPGFSKGGDWTSDRFDPEVIDFIKKGTPTVKDQTELKERPLPAVVKIGDSKDDLAGADVFIVSPMRQNSKDNSFNYPSKVPKVQDALKAELPNDVKFHDVPYVRPDEGDVAQVLFEYDPRAPKKVVRLFLTGHMVFEGEPGGKIDTHPPAK
ncbi:uncharacterized protein PG998_003872 [Apiospora kogelbergensis]|uniref:uncharacterized protein n=1 Tax=Apiospora kogelbergensis TaxID=1337665 RepID=UPI0031318107